MRIRTVLPAAALLLATFTWPAEASHRHSRFCGHFPVGHRFKSPYHAYRSPHFGYGDPYAYPYASPYAYSYGYRPPLYYGAPPMVYAPYGYGYGYGYRHYAPPLLSFHYHGGLRCRRPHVNLHLGF